MERRLTTILAADVVGYSRLMGADEAGTLAALKADRSSLIDPKATQHGGRIIKLMGDGILMEFASVVGAVKFAIDVQLSVSARSNKSPIQYRIGINIGDVIAEDDDIYGDGVNVAARLEGLADTGGICIGRSVRDQIRDKLDVALEDLGEVKVKNIARPVRAFRVVLDDRASALTTPVMKDAGSAPASSRKLILVALGGILLVGSAALVWLQPWTPRVDPARVEAMALPLPDKPSIAVMPFNNMSPAESADTFADGMTEDLITDLSKVSGLFVIARDSTFAYKGTTANTKTVAEDLGVRYVLKGSVRRAGEKLRVNAQLVDATTGGNLWAEKFDGRATDIFAVQDDFVLKIVNALTIKLTEQEKSGIEKIDTSKLEAREAFQKGWELYSRFNARDNAKSVSHFEKAVELDPEYGRAYGALALVYARTIFFRWYQTLGIRSGPIHSEKLPENLRKARQYSTSLVHVVSAMKQMFYWDSDVAEGPNRGTDAARIEAARAIALQPSDPEAHIVMAWALIASGKPGEGLNFVKAAMRLNPNYPSHYVFFDAAAYYAMGELQQAAEILRKGMARDPHATELAPLAAAIFARLGLRREAREAVMNWRPGTDQSDLQDAAANYRVPIGWVDLSLRTRLLDGLQLAALPQETTVPALVAELVRNGGSVQLGTIRALGWFGPAAAPAVPGLMNILETAHIGIRKEAVITLGKIGPDANAAVPALKALTDTPLIGFHARVALDRIAGN